MSWLQKRQTKFWSYASLYVLVVLAILTAINWLAQRHVKSWDSTANKRFSLSDQTEKIVKGLKQDVKIVHFDRTSAFTQAKDLLDRYDVMSTKLSVEYIDPDKKPMVAKSYGLRSIPTTYVEVGGKREEARSLTEEEVTSALIRALKPGERVVCSVQGSGEKNFDDFDRSNGYSSLKSLLERNNYKTRSIRLIEKPEIPKDCTIVLVAGPRFDYLQPAVDALRSYFLAGGKIFFLLDPPLKMARSEISENAALLKLLEDLGVTAQKNLILDTSGVGQLFGLSEVVPLVTNYESHVTVRDMREVATAYPLARSLETKATSIAQVEKLFSTGSNSYATENLSSPEIRINPSKDKKGPHLLAVAGTSTGGTGGPEGAKGRFVVVGSSGFMANSLIGFNGNRDMAMNLFNWLSADEDLISIRPKDPQDRRLSLTRSQMRLVFYSSMIVLPLLVLVAGVSVWWKRR
ncbi:MAG: GldG family protein [Bryobacteraceae bacterium]|nr:GldG family protein [Bryobacteraceae bacterium]MDW8378767.1 GldG family protein [Bryobacterales bacterium]